MKKNYTFYFLLILLINFSILIFPWGDKGHKLINRKAVELLPEEMKSFGNFSDHILRHAADPDYRKKDDSTEFPKHFIDLDFYKEFNSGNPVINKAELIKLYGDSTVTEMGTLPWATLNTYENLVNAFKESDISKILLFASDLGHYVADGHQPMHTLMNYDGQLSAQKGLHARYEWKMIDRFIEEIDSAANGTAYQYVELKDEFIFEYISAANSVAPVIFSGDKDALEFAGNTEDENYFNILRFRTKYITDVQLDKAIEALASLYYSAWIDAGKPDLQILN